MFSPRLSPHAAIAAVVGTLRCHHGAVQSSACLPFATAQRVQFHQGCGRSPLRFASHRPARPLAASVAWPFYLVGLASPVGWWVVRSVAGVAWEPCHWKAAALPLQGAAMSRVLPTPQALPHLAFPWLLYIGRYLVSCEFLWPACRGS